MSEEVRERYLALEVPDDELVGAIAQEAALNDPGLDALEAQLAAPDLDPGEAAAVALTVGRAGRPRARGRLEALRARLVAAGHEDEAWAVSLASALLAPRPEGVVERADEGYRMQVGASRLYVEDPVAAYWHRRGRWGPPIRPDLERGPRLLRGAGRVEAAAAQARDGAVLVVTFRPHRWFGVSEPPLRLCRAGLSRAPDLQGLVRWAEIGSLGRLESTKGARVAYAGPDGVARGLPAAPSIPAEDLLTLMERLLKDARS